MTGAQRRGTHLRNTRVCRPRNSAVAHLLATADDDAIAAFTLCCAERGRPFYQSFAEIERVERFDLILNLAWDVAAGAADDDAAFEEFENAQDAISESEHDESPEGLALYSQQAQLLALSALGSTINPSPQSAILASNTLETIFSGIDFTLSDDLARIHRPDDVERPLGNFQQRERQAQEASLEAVLSHPVVDFRILRENVQREHKWVLDAIRMSHSY